MKYFLVSFVTTLVLLIVFAVYFFGFNTTGKFIWNTYIVQPTEEKAVQSVHELQNQENNDSFEVIY